MKVLQKRRSDDKEEESFRTCDLSGSFEKDKSF